MILALNVVNEVALPERRSMRRSNCSRAAARQKKQLYYVE
jgi:hypothetical protein